MTPLLSMLAGARAFGLTAFKNLFEPAGAFDALGTIVIGTSNVSSITFSNIPTGYKHLQVRVSARTVRGTYGNDQMYMQINGDGGYNYSYHFLSGNGGSASASSSSSNNIIDLSFKLGTTVSGAMGAYIIDFLDYSSQTKLKTTRTLCGVDINGTTAGYGGEVGLLSGLWQSTNPITSFTLFANYAQFTQHSSFTLYGVR